MKRLFLILFILGASWMNAQATPALRKAQKVIQPDGTELTVIQKGDEFFHYFTTLDNVALFREANGSFTYATVDANGKLSGSALLAHNLDKRNEAELQHINKYRLTSIEECKETIAERNRANMLRAASRIGGTVNNTGHVRIPVILAQFSNYSFTLSKEEMNLHFNGEDYKGDHEGSYGSVRDYFIAQSDSQFVPDFEVIGPITVPNGMSYYGGNNRTNASGGKSLVTDACNIATETVDFSSFDNNGDGTVDFLYVIFAGYDEASYGSDSTLWSHQNSITLQLDGVTLSQYACSSELLIGGQIDGIGTICHEFSHCLGLPDFYDTTKSNYFGMDYWSLMDYGCYALDGYCPSGYTSYEREFVGWMDIETIDEPANLLLEPLNEGGKAYRIVNNANSNEYYILENRQLTKWDSYFPNHGLLILHVDYSSSIWSNNTVNTVKDHQRMTLCPADGELLPYSKESSKLYAQSLLGDTWPGSSGNTTFTDETTPAATVYTGGLMHKPITDIKEENGIITLRFMGGILSVPDASLFVTDSITTTGFQVTWEAVEGANLYTVELYSSSNMSFANLVSDFSTYGTSTVFDDLNPDTNYFLRIKAANDYVESAFSNLVEITLTPTGIQHNSIKSVVTVKDNLLLVQAPAGTPVAVYSIDGALITQFATESSSTSRPLAKGIYLIKAGNKVHKCRIK